jgi:queuine/archaeosine tRNA-ribosyltransferase
LHNLHYYHVHLASIRSAIEAGTLARMRLPTGSESSEPC